MLTSTKLSNILKTVQKQHDVSSTLLRPLCPTRVLCRGPALKCILNNLDCILVQQYADLAPSDTAAKAQGFANVVGHCNFVLWAEMCRRCIGAAGKPQPRCAVKQQLSGVDDHCHADDCRLEDHLHSDDAFKAIYDDTAVLCRECDVFIQYWCDKLIYSYYNFF